MRNGGRGNYYEEKEYDIYIYVSIFCSFEWLQSVASDRKCKSIGSFGYAGKRAGEDI